VHRLGSSRSAAATDEVATIICMHGDIISYMEPSASYQIKVLFSSKLLKFLGAKSFRSFYEAAKTS